MNGHIVITTLTCFYFCFFVVFFSHPTLLHFEFSISLLSSLPTFPIPSFCFTPAGINRKEEEEEAPEAQFSCLPLYSKKKCKSKTTTTIGSNGRKRREEVRIFPPFLEGISIYNDPEIWAGGNGHGICERREGKERKGKEKKA